MAELIPEKVGSARLGLENKAVKMRLHAQRYRRLSKVFHCMADLKNSVSSQVRLLSVLKYLTPINA